ncbi:PET127 [[Candida] subhashii]|uniref:PET127 n=1 Tax=[Candida] subhashii TaxID=561895 RepID=A0A8J5UKA7_9ASCO|nr:PET127 [[Candida] subhashii]KAG7665313.1 PET127 [[Candida] subhashii]
MLAISRRSVILQSAVCSYRISPIFIRKYAGTPNNQNQNTQSDIASQESEGSKKLHSIFQKAKDVINQQIPTTNSVKGESSKPANGNQKTVTGVSDTSNKSQVEKKSDQKGRDKDKKTVSQKDNIKDTGDSNQGMDSKVEGIFAKAQKKANRPTSTSTKSNGGRSHRAGHVETRNATMGTSKSGKKFVVSRMAVKEIPNRETKEQPKNNQTSQNKPNNKNNNSNKGPVEEKSNKKKQSGTLAEALDKQVNKILAEKQARAANAKNAKSNSNTSGLFKNKKEPESKENEAVETSTLSRDQLTATSKGENVHSYWTADALSTEITQCVPPDPKKIPVLAHNLDRVLFSPGVHFLQDPRTRVYNFDPFLKKVISHKDFNFDTIETFQRVSKDTTLLEKAKEFSKVFYSSTSSMTGVLTKFYLLLNNYSPALVSRFGDVPFSGMSFSSPSSVFVRGQGVNDEGETIYSIESDKSCDTEILLSAMGNCLEVLLTNPEDEFVKYRKDSGIKDTKAPPNQYNYAGYNGFLLRSQLDCYDERLPGNGTFDLKTRASLSIRHDQQNPKLEQNTYQVWKLKGEYESFAREREDLIRTGAMMKYMFQARIGQMDGIFIAYHNINSMFGFEYIPLSELDEIFYSNKIASDNAAPNVSTSLLPEHTASFVAESQFKFSLEIWETLLRDNILQQLKKDEKGAFRLTFQKMNQGGRTKLRAFVLPVTDEEVLKLQEFPDQYDTRFDMAPSKKLANMRRHGEQLKRYNEKLLESKKQSLKVFDIEIVGAEIGKDIKRVYQSLPHKESPWAMCYKITRLDADNEMVRMYSRLVEMGPDSLKFAGTSNPLSPKEQNRKYYTRLGATRTRHWGHLEKQKGVIIYKPKY